ncbi:MAG: zf-HC2 domain-containing protein [candidate division WOR-3 bacterium]|nr:MAG: zf-HC2 domain-containing protein [candidate division WOR-3 bacterium]
MITCGKTADLIVEYLDGALSGSDKQDLLYHLSKCPRCSHEYEKHAELYRIMREDEVVFPPAAVFDHIKEKARQAASGRVRVTFTRSLRFLLPAAAAAIMLLVVIWPRGRTVEFGVPVATLIEDVDIASIAVAAVIDEDMAHDLSTIEYYLFPETEQAIDELTADEKNELVNFLQERYPVGT